MSRAMPKHHDSARPARILILTDGLGIGGAERQLALLVRHLPYEWHRLLWSMSDGPFAQTLRNDGIEVRTGRRAGRLDPRPALELAVLIHRWRPDVVHSWGWMCSLTAGPLCRLLGIPLVDGTIRAGYVPPRRRHMSRLTLRWATRVIANSRAGLAAWRIPPHLGRVVYNGFHHGRLQSCTRNASPEKHRHTVVMTGRMVWEKDFDSFIAAARYVATAGSGDWRFLIVGDGPDRKRLETEAAALVAAGVVEFARPGIEVLPMVCQADVGVLMSHPDHAEGCSNSIMEYMACGLPVVCTDSGGNRELVADGSTGIIVAPRDVDALARTLLRLRQTPLEAARLGETGKQRIQREFSIENMIRSTIAVYREAMRAKHPEPALRKDEAGA